MQFTFTESYNIVLGLEGARISSTLFVNPQVSVITLEIVLTCMLFVKIFREGVQFMFECVAGLRGMAISKNPNTTSGGCILADDMGYVDHLLLKVSVATVHAVGLYF